MTIGQHGDGVVKGTRNKEPWCAVCLLLLLPCTIVPCTQPHRGLSHISYIPRARDNISLGLVIHVGTYLTSAQALGVVMAMAQPISGLVGDMAYLTPP